MPLVRLLVLLFNLALILGGCSEATNGTGSISQRIGEVVRTPGTKEVDLGKLTSFGWDRFYTLKPGTTREEVCRLVNAKRNVCGRIVRIERAPDDHMFLIFALGGQVTHIELHALSNGHFDVDVPEAGFPRSASVFKVRRSSAGNGEDIWLEPKRSATDPRSE